MTVTWVMVADSTQANIYLYQGPDQPLRPVPDAKLQHPDEPGRNLVTDRPGRRADPGQGQRSAMTPATDPREHEKQVFAREAGNFLNRHSADFDRLVLVAPARFLGGLRQQLSGPVKKKVSGELDKELANVPEHELPKHLQALLNIHPPPRSAYHS